MRKLLFVMIVLVLVSLPIQAEQAKVQWEVQGTMADACQCLVFCSCEFNEKPSFGHCDDSAILDITKGHYGDVSLDGMKVVVVSQSPKGERLVDTVGKLNFARIYVPADSTDDQMNALAQVSRYVFGAFVTNAQRISEDEKVQKVPMTVKIADTTYSIRIPNILNLDIEALTGGDGKTPMVLKNSPFTAAGFGDAMIGKSKTYTFTADGKNWDYAGRSASIRSFHLKGE